jgi:hypothetical protein
MRLDELLATGFWILTLGGAPPPAAPELVTPPTTAPLVLELRSQTCKSEANTVSIALKQPVAFSDLFPLLEGVSEMELSAEADVSKIQVKGSVSGAPWDCLLEDLAKQAGLRLDVAPQKVTITKAPDPPAAKPDPPVAKPDPPASK